jgi:hypothetical protein
LPHSQTPCPPVRPSFRAQHARPGYRRSRAGPIRASHFRRCRSSQPTCIRPVRENLSVPVCPANVAGERAMRVAQIERHLVGTLRRPDVDLHSFRPMRTWDPSAPHRAATDGRARSGWPGYLSRVSRTLHMEAPVHE